MDVHKDKLVCVTSLLVIQGMVPILRFHKWMQSVDAILMLHFVGLEDNEANANESQIYLEKSQHTSHLFEAPSKMHPKCQVKSPRGCKSTQRPATSSQKG